MFDFYIYYYNNKKITTIIIAMNNCPLHLIMQPVRPFNHYPGSYAAAEESKTLSVVIVTMPLSTGMSAARRLKETTKGEELLLLKK